MSTRNRAAICALFIIATLITACAAFSEKATDNPSTYTDEVIFYDWEADIPAELITAFSAEYSIKVKYLTYESQTEALDNLRQGIEYDVAVFDNSLIPTLVAENLIVKINYENVTNIKNISANFRDLIYDPGNKYSIPFNWGTTGLLVREDLLKNNITQWADLWTISTPQKILLWKSARREVIGLTLKSLGFSENSEDPAELKMAEEKLFALRSKVIFIEDINPEAISALELMDDQRYPVALGWAYGAILGAEHDPPITYILPAEGTILWGDNFVIPASSQHKASAELFLNFLLRPEISAQITNQNLYANANEAANEYIDPQILMNPIIYPDTNELMHAGIILPLSAKGESLTRQLWGRFIDYQP